MKFPLKYILFITGIISVFVSFLFFARENGTYTMLILGGLLFSTIGYLTILFGKGSIKSKIIWTIVLAFSITTEKLTSPTLIKGSFLIYLHNNKHNLNEINNILINHEGTFHMYGENVITEHMDLTIQEVNTLKKLKKSVNSYMITKDDSKIYYGIYGFLDVRHGVTYLINGSKLKTQPQPAIKKLIGNWYY